MGDLAFSPASRSVALCFSPPCKGAAGGGWWPGDTAAHAPAAAVSHHATHPRPFPRRVGRRNHHV